MFKKGQTVQGVRRKEIEREGRRIGFSMNRKWKFLQGKSDESLEWVQHQSSKSIPHHFSIRRINRNTRMLRLSRIRDFENEVMNREYENLMKIGEKNGLPNDRKELNGEDDEAGEEEEHKITPVLPKLKKLRVVKTESVKRKNKKTNLGRTLTSEMDNLEKELDSSIYFHSLDAEEEFEGGGRDKKYDSDDDDSGEEQKNKRNQTKNKEQDFDDTLDLDSGSERSSSSDEEKEQSIGSERFLGSNRYSSPIGKPSISAISSSPNRSIKKKKKKKKKYRNVPIPSYTSMHPLSNIHEVIDFPHQLRVRGYTEDPNYVNYRKRMLKYMERERGNDHSSLTTGTSDLYGAFYSQPSLWEGVGIKTKRKKGSKFKTLKSKGRHNTMMMMDQVNDSPLTPRTIEAVKAGDLTEVGSHRVRRVKEARIMKPLHETISSKRFRQYLVGRNEDVPTWLDPPNNRSNNGFNSFGNGIKKKKRKRRKKKKNVYHEKYKKFLKEISDVNRGAALESERRKKRLKMRKNKGKVIDDDFKDILDQKDQKRKRVNIGELMRISSDMYYVNSGDDISRKDSDQDL